MVRYGDPGRLVLPSKFGLLFKGDIQNYVPVTDAMLTHPPAGDWLMLRRNYQGWSYSPLAQITTANVDQLQLKWMWSMPENGTMEITPLVHSGVLFMWGTGNTIQALNAKTGELLWENRLGPAPRRPGPGPSTEETRSMGLWGNNIYVNTPHGMVYALDARTGKEVWKNNIVDYKPGIGGSTGGLIIIKGRVLVGMTNCGRPKTDDHCYISAYDAATGKRDWKFVTVALKGQPGGDSWGKLPDNERRRLRDILKHLIPEGAGVIVRTAAEGASADELERDVNRLQAQWEDIQAKSVERGAPVLLYEEPDLVIRVVRDLFNEDFRDLVIQGGDAYDTVQMYLKHVSPDLVPRLHRYTGTSDVFAERRIDEQILKGLDRKVYLPSGGSLVIDRTEAMTVIDVNTGKYTGTGGNLEETVTRNNLEAAEEIVRQLRLRDIGGIVVIDFIDMANPKNRQAVEDAFRTELERDRTKTYVVEISPLGLVEMTRQKVTEGPREVMTRKCPTCSGDGIVVSDATVALEVERRLKALAAAGAGSRVQAYRIAVHPRTLALLAGDRPH